MDFLDNMINAIAGIYFNNVPTMIKVNKKMYDLLMEECQNKDIDYEAPIINDLQTLKLVIDENIPDYDFKIE